MPSRSCVGDSMRLQGNLIGDSLRLSVLSELRIAIPLLATAVILLCVTRGLRD